MHRDNTTSLARRRDFLKDDMAAALAINEESESLQGFDRLRARHDGQFRSLLKNSSGVFLTAEAEEGNRGGRRVGEPD